MHEWRFMHFAVMQDIAVFATFENNGTTQHGCKEFRLFGVINQIKEKTHNTAISLRFGDRLLFQIKN